MSPGEDLLPGPVRDLVLELRALHRDAGTPSVRLLSSAIAGRDDAAETVSHETISSFLRGDGIPRWHKVEVLVRQLLDMAVTSRDVQTEMQRFHALWVAATTAPAEIDVTAATGGRLGDTWAAPDADAGATPQPDVRRPWHGDGTPPAKSDGVLLGRRVAYWRTRRRMSQQVFADRLGRSKSWVDKIERGVRRIDRYSTIGEIADVLGIDVSFLLGTTGFPAQAGAANATPAIARSQRDRAATPLSSASDAAATHVQQPMADDRASVGAAIAGPRHVTFVVAARGREDMRAVRTELDVYGASWADWRPYYPVCMDRIVVRAQEVAASLGLTSDAAAADDSLPELVGDARRRNDLVILLFDPWVVRLRDCAEPLSAFDGLRSLHACVVVPWETGELETARAEVVEDAMLAVLGNWAEAGNHAFRNRVDSMDLLIDTLSEMILAGRARIARHTEVLRRASAATLADAAPLASPT